MQIQVSVEDVSSVRKKLEVEIPSEVVEQEFEAVSRQFRGQARLPGFRPGKAPLALVKRNFRKEIRNEVVQNLVPRSYQQALGEQPWTPVGQPRIGDLDFGEQGPLRYVASLEVFPELKLPPYEGLRVADVDEDVSGQEVASAMQELRERHARFEPVEDRPVQEGDLVTIDLGGEYLLNPEDPEAELPEPFRQEDYTLEVGGENTHEAFTGALSGMNLAQEKTFEVSYPQDVPEEKLAGRRVRFTAEVTDIRSRVLPELDDDFARLLGEFEDLEQLRNRVRQDLEHRKKHDRETQIRNRLLGQLVEQTGFELPESLVEERIDSKVRDLAYNIASQGVDLARAGVDWAKLRGDLRPQAEREIRGELILDRIAEEQEIPVEPRDEAEELGRVAQSMKAPLEKVRGYFRQEGRMEELRAGLRRRKALEWLREQAVVE